MATSKSPKVVRLVVPMPENIANGAHGHWRGRHNAKVRYWGLLDGLQASGAIPAPPRHALKRASMRSVMLLGNAMDDSNAMRRHKWVEDWLKTRGYIVDDRKKNLKWEAFPEQIVKRNGQYSIELTITPIEEEAA